MIQMKKFINIKVNKMKNEKVVGVLVDYTWAIILVVIILIELVKGC